MKRKIEQYNVQACNIYNMDEKGFSLGTMTKQYRIFTKEAVQRKRVLGHSQDGNREWITIIATICADGSWCPPAIIFAGKTPYLQTSWVDDVELGQHNASFATSPNGWTNDALGVAWLDQVFNKATKKKARNGRDWRLLFIDGHGSYVTRQFLDWCDNNRVLLAIYPPHSTHRLQPLDVSLFSPLATFYSQQLNRFIHQCQGLSGLGKSDFFALFWPAYIAAFTPANIASGFRKTGLYPFNSELVLSMLTKHPNGLEEDDISRPLSNHSSGSSALSQINIREVRNLVLTVANEVVYELTSNKQRRLENTVLHLQDKITMLQRRNIDLQATANYEKKKRKRKKKAIEQLREEDGQGAIFLSPSKIQQYRDFEDRKEQTKLDEQAAKQVAKEQQQQAKLAKEENAERKRQQRLQQKEQQQVALVAAKAAKETAKEASNASKQLNNDLQLSTKKPKRQQHLQSIPLLLLPLHNQEVVVRPSNPALERPLRSKRAPAYSDGYQLE